MSIKSPCVLLISHNETVGVYYIIRSTINTSFYYYYLLLLKPLQSLKCIPIIASNTWALVVAFVDAPLLGPLSFASLYPSVTRHPLHLMDIADPTFFLYLDIILQLCLFQYRLVCTYYDENAMIMISDLILSLKIQLVLSNHVCHKYEPHPSLVFPLFYVLLFFFNSSQIWFMFINLDACLPSRLPTNSHVLRVYE